jgi:hypothetical protein
VKGMYKIQIKMLFEWEDRIVIAAKISAVLLPAIFIGVPFSHAVQDIPIASLLIGSAPSR